MSVPVKRAFKGSASGGGEEGEKVSLISVLFGLESFFVLGGSK